MYGLGLQTVYKTIPTQSKAHTKPNMMCNCGDTSVRQQSEKRTDKHQMFIKYRIINL